MHEIFKKRHCVRGFSDKAVEREKIDEIMEAAHSAPSAGNLKSRDFIIVEEGGLKEKLVEAANDQTFIGEASAVIVFVALPDISAEKYESRGKKLYCIQDATIAGAYAWLQAVDLGLGACWVGGFDEEKVKKILDLKENQRPIAIMPIGYEE